MMPLDPAREYLLALRPTRDPLTWMRLAICPPGLFRDRGCGLPTRWVYMGGPKARPWFAICPVCGRKAVFAFWKMKTDHEFRPTAEQEKDVRALYADWKRMAKGAEATYGKEMWECIVIHCPPGIPTRLVAALIALGRAA